MAFELAAPVLRQLTKCGCRGSLSALNTCGVGWLAKQTCSPQGHHVAGQPEQHSMGPLSWQFRAFNGSSASPFGAGVLHCPPPREPAPDECCQCGCPACVWDLYDEEYRKWQSKQNEFAPRPATLSSVSADAFEQLEAELQMQQEIKQQQQLHQERLRHIDEMRAQRDQVLEQRERLRSERRRRRREQRGAQEAAAAGTAAKAGH
ncbi:hypothetical protein DUNSADRAFT_8457 [Dunaliella salina]|uniref:Oxidoreductase-like domain-containing protein n=1 Tax=Dunaliella salina TaxID=3046 RepID=A0ABQ7GJH7_DUNSA|nr:hypothetical protein DUNSADRAFT_8457 [Dunaliella salina]|eukprot:KAF5834769.1 hypothetical protein DUNSADRAFT_8457 [Dunaliella salina]